jgi:hypothetical protein
MSRPVDIKSAMNILYWNPCSNWKLIEDLIIYFRQFIIHIQDNTCIKLHEIFVLKRWCRPAIIYTIDKSVVSQNTRCEVLTAMKLSMLVLRVVVPCGLVARGIRYCSKFFSTHHAILWNIYRYSYVYMKACRLYIIIIPTKWCWEWIIFL